MKRFEIILLTLTMLLALSSCNKLDQGATPPPAVENPMIFGVENIVQTKIIYDKDNTTNKINTEFENGDNVGLYAFYNNFYYWYNDYQGFAESVIFPNTGMYINTDSSTKRKSLIYEPLRSWTFSTIYGDAPHTLDVVSYYPHLNGYHPEQMQMVNTNAETDSSAILEYYYAYYKTNVETRTGATTTSDQIVINSNKDFMTAHTRYDYHDKNAAEFRTAMLELPSIELKFTRHTAAMNMQITKPATFAEDRENIRILVNGFSVEFDSPIKFTHKIQPFIRSSSENAQWDMSTMASDKFGKLLSANITLKEPFELNTTGWADIPDADLVYNIDDLIEDPEDMPHFPPGTEIEKIIFNITVITKNANKQDISTQREYIWHPHIAPIEANTTFILTLELDPDRKN